LLAAASRLLPRERWASFLVRPATILRWHRELVRRKWTFRRKPPGRPPMSSQVRELILRLARENPLGVREDPGRAPRSRHLGRSHHYPDIAPTPRLGTGTATRRALLGRVPSRAGRGDPGLRLLLGRDRLPSVALRPVFIELGTRRVHVDDFDPQPRCRLHHPAGSQHLHGW
jgi:hypothetical protein